MSPLDISDISSKRESKKGESMRKRRIASAGLVLLATALLCQGCGVWKKYSANSAIKKVKQTLERAQQGEADRYASDEFASAQSLIAQAESDVESKNYEEALNKTNEAESKALKAIEMVAQNRQVVQRKNQELQQLEALVVETLDKAERSPSRAVAESEIAQARERFDALKKEMEQLRRQRAQKAEDYDAGIAQVTELTEQAQRAYNLTLAETANALSQTLQAKLAILEQLQFKEFIPETAETIAAQYSEYVDLFEQQAFEKGLEIGGALDRMLDEQVPIARKTRAVKSVERAEAFLAKAATLGGLEFAPEQLKAGQQALADARVQLEALQYDQAFNIALQAVGSADVTMEEIKRSIEGRIDTLQARIVEAEEAGAERFAAEDLVRGRAKLAQAFNFLTDDDYQSARAVQLEAATAVDRAFQAAKKGRAQEKLNRVAEVLQRADAQGASRYTPASLLAAQEKLSEARTIFRQEDFVGVHPVADLAENLAYKTLADLAEKGEEQIAQAEKQLAAAQEAQAEQYASDLTAQAAKSIGQAKVQLAADEYLLSLQQSELSLKAGKQAEDQAYRLRTDQKRASADKERQLAIDSGAKEHSSAVFLQALQQEELSGKQYASHQFKNALEAVTRADDGFRAARLSKIRRATQAVQSAVAALAEQYDSETISGAQSLLSESKLDMDAQTYGDSNRKADEAFVLAGQAEVTTWNRRSTDQIAEWEEAFASAVQNFAETKAPEALDASKNKGVEAKADFVVQDFKASYENAVEAMQALGATNQILDQQTEVALAGMRDRLSELSVLVQDEAGRAVLSERIEQVGAADKARQAKDFHTVFLMEKDFLAAADEAERVIKTHNVEVGRDALKGQLTALTQQGITNFLQESTAKLSDQLAGIDAKEAVEQYAESQEQLGQIRQEIERFPALAKVQLQRDISEMQRQLNESKQAGALDLIPEQYGEAFKAYNLVQAYPRPNGGGNYNELYALVKDARTKTEATFSATKLEINLQTYREVLQSYIKEMNSLLDNFSSVTDYDERFYTSSGSTRQVDVYRELQHDITATTLRRRSELLLDKASDLNPPPSQKATQNVALEMFRELVAMADRFERFGQYEKYDKLLRDEYIIEAFAKRNRVKELSTRVQQLLLGEKESGPGLKFWKLFSFK